MNNVHSHRISGPDQKTFDKLLKDLEKQEEIIGVNLTNEEIAEMLDSFDTAYYSCHCTGVEQYNFMKTRVRRLEYLSTGSTVTI